MLCSECSKAVKPVVAIDIDGTLGDYHAHFLAFASAYLGAPAEEGYQGGESFRVWFCREYQVRENTWHDIKLAYRQGAQKRSMPMYHYADFLVNALREEAEVWLTTTRPYLRLDNVDPDTRAWLRRSRIAYDALLYDEDKYGVLARSVEPERVVAVLDDLPEQYEAAQLEFGEAIPILRKTRWNAGVSKSWSVKNLEEAYTRILPRVKNWRESYG